MVVLMYSLSRDKKGSEITLKRTKTWIDERRGESHCYSWRLETVRSNIVHNADSSELPPICAVARLLYLAAEPISRTWMSVMCGSVCSCATTLVNTQL